MLEVDCAYEFFGEDGTRAVLGNGAEAQADPDWCGLLDPASGITGLIEGGEIRTTGGDRPGRHGGYSGAGLIAARNGTVNGVLSPNILAPQRRDRFELLTRAVYALSGDGVLRWTPTGGAQRIVRFRTRSLPTLQGRIPKTFQFTLETPDPVNLGAVEKGAIAVGGTVGGMWGAETGLADPLTDPLSSVGGLYGSVVVTNAGNVRTTPRFRVVNTSASTPLTGLRITNVSTGRLILLASNLAAGAYLDIYPDRGEIIENGATDRSSWFSAGLSSWWDLAPGHNVVTVSAASAATSELTVAWRDGYR